MPPHNRDSWPAWALGAERFTMHGTEYIRADLVAARVADAVREERERIKAALSVKLAQWAGAVPAYHASLADEGFNAGAIWAFRRVVKMIDTQCTPDRLNRSAVDKTAKHVFGWFETRANELKNRD